MSKPQDKQGHLVSTGDPKCQVAFAETCRASSMWSINEFAVCLVSPPHHCGYVLSYGGHFYCHHPRREEIAMRTLQTGENGRLNPARDIQSSPRPDF
jgi:hypothetical protein